LLVLQKRGLFAFFPVITHMSASLEIGRADWAGVLGWKLSRLEEAESACSFVSHIVCVAGLCAGPFTDVFVGVHEAESCQGDVSGAALRARACGLITSKTHLLAARSCMSITCRDVVASHALPDAFAARVQKDRSLFATVRGRRSQAASLRSKTPFLYVGLNENESHLSKINVDLARSLCADCREEVLSLESVCNVVKLLAITCEKDCSCARPVPNSDNVSLNVSWSVSGRCEGLVVTSVAV
jgi:hypothetical protein